MDGPPGDRGDLEATPVERGLTAEDFEGPRYVRLRRIQQLAAEGRLDLKDLRLR